MCWHRERKNVLVCVRRPACVGDCMTTMFVIEDTYVNVLTCQFLEQDIAIVGL